MFKSLLLRSFSSIRFIVNWSLQEFYKEFQRDTRSVRGVRTSRGLSLVHTICGYERVSCAQNHTSDTQTLPYLKVGRWRDCVRLVFHISEAVEKMFVQGIRGSPNARSLRDYCLDETREQYVLIGADGTSVLGPIVDQMRWCHGCASSLLILLGEKWEGLICRSSRQSTWEATSSSSHSHQFWKLYISKFFLTHWTQPRCVTQVCGGMHCRP